MPPAPDAAAPGGRASRSPLPPRAIAAATPLDALLASSSLSKVLLLFDHESDGGGLLPLSVQCDGDDGRRRKAQLQSLNAAKVSLMLVKAIASALSSGTLSASDLPSLQMGDYCVRLQRVGASSPSEDAPMPLLDECGEGDRWIIRDVEITPKTAEAGAGNGELPRDERGDGDCIRHVGEMLHATFPCIDDDDEQVCIRYLGEMLHAIFSGGSVGLPFASVQPAKGTDTSGHESNGEGGQRTSRARRRAENSWFQTLLDMDEYPVAVCRLISSMTGDGDGCPITSLDDALQDLEQMSNNPQIFLFDQSNEFYSRTLHLGQGYYGRVEELTTLLGIATRSAEEASAAVDEGGSRSSTPSVGSGVDAVFVSGVAGRGKSYFVQYAGNHLANLGWMVLKKKFMRGMEHESLFILSSLFEEMISNLVSMRDGENEADTEYSRQASEAISNALDRDSLSSLANFVPVILDLLPEIDNRYSVNVVEGEMTHWQLVFLLSKLLGAMLRLDRRIMICLDDVQWCEASTIRLVSDVLVAMGQHQEAGKQRLLFVGMYRDNEVTDSHPLTQQLSALKQSSNVDVEEIALPSLSKDDIADLLMAEMRLPRRMVLGLAASVHKRTSGHALFAVQLLNALLRDSLIAFSPSKRRFDWDKDQMATLRTCDSVASLIVSNLSHLEPDALQSLRILSCFGLRSDMSLLKLLDDSPISPEGGVEPFLLSLADRGILEMSGSSGIGFAHDLIQQHVYENVPNEERWKLHVDIGLFLGSMTTLDSSTSRRSSIEEGMEELYINADTVGGVKSSTLVSIAVDQINAAGPQFITDVAQRARFAGWNLHAGKKAARCSSFQAALHNYQSGKSFLADGLWLGDATFQLCQDLDEGAAVASFALGDMAKVEVFTKAIIEHVPFENSLVAQDLHIRSLEVAGKYHETIARGLAVLRLLEVSIPSDPNPLTVMQAMHETGRVTSQFSSDQIVNMKRSINARKRMILKIADAVVTSCYRKASPYLPLVTCAMVNYSLQNDAVCKESVTCFVVYGYFHIFLSENFDDARRWGDIALEMIDSNSVFARMTLYGFLLCWFVPQREGAAMLLDTYEVGMRIGAVDSAMYALSLNLRFSFFGGENLSLLSQRYRKCLKLMAKYNRECLKYTAIDPLLVDGLTGVDSNPFAAFEGTIPDERVLLADAKYKKHNQSIESIYNRRFFSSFWKGDYAEARKWFDLATALPSSQMPKIQLIYRTFYRGIMSYQMYRDGEGEEWLDEGKAALEKVQLWEKHCSKAIFGNKLILLEAEHYASSCNIVAAKESYELAAKKARDNGLVHEQGLACECMGLFLASIVDLDAANWFRKAHTCYVDWGAAAKAEQLQKDHNLSFPDESRSVMFGSAKHKRDEGEEPI